MKEIRVCEKCGASVEVIKDCKCENCGIKCCGQEMSVIVANSVDAAREKHLPTYEVVGAYIIVTVNHVMEQDHFIEWVSLDGECTCGRKFFKVGENAKAVFPYIKGSKICSYCNKHGLWETIVE